MKKINVLSLFDGMSCGQVALNKIGIEYDNYFASEIDKYAIQVTQKNFPNTIQIGSVMDINTNELPPIDLLIGGSPCQSFTFAGKRVGMTTKDKVDILSLDQYLSLKEQGFEFEGESYLFWEYIRILKESKPKYFILENVNSMSKESKAKITEIMGVESIMIDASLVSAQSRKRLFWTNIPIQGLPKDRNIFLKDVLQSGEIDERMTSKGKAFCLDASYYKGSSAEHSIKRKNRTLIKLEEQFRKLTPIECERLQGLSDNYTEGISNTQRYKCLGNAFNVDVICFILSFIN